MTIEELTITRRFEAELELGDGRTILGRIVPYNVAAEVIDPSDGAGAIPYLELWRHGAFRHIARAAKAGRSVPAMLNYEHRTDLPNQIGHLTDLEELEDGLYGTFRAFDSQIGEHGLELVRSKACTGLSVQAIVPRRARQLEDGTIERTIAKRLEHVALTSSPAFAGAGVTAVRSAAELELEVEQPRLADVRAYTAAARLRYAPKS